VYDLSVGKMSVFKAKIPLLEPFFMIRVISEVEIALFSSNTTTDKC